LATSLHPYFFLFSRAKIEALNRKEDQFLTAKEERRKNGRRMTKHHILPQSRGGNGKHNGKKNTKKIPERFHTAWHTLFGNMTVSETIRFIRIVMEDKGLENPKGRWTQKELYALQIELQRKTLSNKKLEEMLSSKHATKKFLRSVATTG
jgi:hypothetical protein